MKSIDQYQIHHGLRLKVITDFSLLAGSRPMRGRVNAEQHASDMRSSDQIRSPESKDISSWFLTLNKVKLWRIDLCAYVGTWNYK